MERKYTVNKKEFEDNYKELILNGDFFKGDNYCVRERPRSYNTLQLVLDNLTEIEDLSQLQVLQIGGGQTGMLLQAMYGCKTIIADVNEQYGDYLINRGFGFRVFDLLYDDIPDRNKFDIVIMREVIGHLSVPPYEMPR